MTLLSALFQQPTPTVDYTPLVIALVSAAVSAITLALQFRKDVAEQKIKRKNESNVANSQLLDQYQEELKECRADRINFRKERSEWEAERDDLIKKVYKLESEKSELNQKVFVLQQTSKRQEDEIIDLRRRLQSALED